MSSMWLVNGSRKTLYQDRNPRNPFSATLLELGWEDSDGDPDSPSQQWLVTQSSTPHDGFPSELRHAVFMEKHRLSSRNVRMGLAFDLSSKNTVLQSGLFASVPLPVTISLPAHVHASWIPAQDRRTIRNDSSALGADLPTDSRYHRFIMQELIPSFYLESLAFINKNYPEHISRFWPRRMEKEEEGLVATSLYRQFQTTDHPVLRTWDGLPISPRDALVHLYCHPAAVQKLLSALQVPEYVSEPAFDTGFFDCWSELRHDSASEVAAVLHKYSQTVMEKCNQDEPSISPEDIGSILKHLVDGEASLVGLPLLPLGDGKVAQFQDDNHPPVFASHTKHIGPLFGHEKTINCKVVNDVLPKLVKLRVNVQDLDSKGLRKLLQTRSPKSIIPGARMAINEEEITWHEKLLERIATQSLSVSLKDLADLPLIPTANKQEVISLEYAREVTVWRRESSEDVRMKPIFPSLGITVVDLQILPSLPLQPSQADVNGVLEMLLRSGSDIPNIHRRVGEENWRRFTPLFKSWLLEPQVVSDLQADSRTLVTLANLPLFSGQQGGTHIPFTSSSRLFMLPSPVNPTSVTTYLPSHLIFAPFSTELLTILEKYDKSRIMSFDQLFEKLNLQDRKLAESEDTSFRALLELFRNYHPGRYRHPLIPDGNRYLKSPHQLSDHRVPLFSKCFHNRPDLFVHPDYRGLIEDLVRLGVHHEIRPAGMIKCIEAVDEETRRDEVAQSRENTQSQDEYTQSPAEWLWDFINENPVKMDGIRYAKIRRLRFIPRHAHRHESNQSLDTHASYLPMVNSPDDMCLSKYSSILWTQRALFKTDPDDLVKMMYRSLGAPNVEHVVIWSHESEFSEV